MSFRRRIVENEFLMSGLAERGYSLSPLDDDENHCAFIDNSPADIAVKILISVWDRVTFRCALLVCSHNVSRQFHSKGLFLDEHVDKAESPEAVLAVELLWLRWNDDPENAQHHRNDYSYVNEAGSRRFFEDLDTLASPLLSSVASATRLAGFLAHLSEYPVHTTLGGRPVSTDPFLYAALLYIDTGDLDEARKVLDRGVAFYSVSDVGTPAQVRRYQNFVERRRLLLS